MADDELTATFHGARNAERRRLQAGRTSESIEYEEWLVIHPRTDIAGLRAVSEKARQDALEEAVRMAETIVSENREDHAFTSYGAQLAATAIRSLSAHE